MNCLPGPRGIIEEEEVFVFADVIEVLGIAGTHTPLPMFDMEIIWPRDENSTVRNDKQDPRSYSTLVDILKELRVKK